MKGKVVMRQTGKNIILMRENTDCEVAAIATVTELDYAVAKKALNWKKLPFSLENPVFGNPYNLYKALLKLGFWKKNITLTMLLNGEYIPLKTIILLHHKTNPYLRQHWAVIGERKVNGVEIYFGDSFSPIIISDENLKPYFLDGFPNVAFQVYKCNLWTKIFNQLKLRIFKK